MNHFASALYPARSLRVAERPIAGGRFLAAPGWVLCALLAISISLASGLAVHAQGSSPEPANASGSQNQSGDTAGAGNARQLAALKKACDIGALSKDECAQRMATLNAQPAQPQRARPQPEQVSSNDPNWNPNQPAPAISKDFRDNQGRYSLAIPDGWAATSAGDGGGSLNLTLGTAWAKVSLQPESGDGGSHPKDITYGILRKMAPQYHDTGMIDENRFKYNGHSAYGAHVGGVDSQGTQVVVTVIVIQASGTNFLSVVSSAPVAQADAVNDQIMQMVHSVRIAGD